MHEEEDNLRDNLKSSCSPVLADFIRTLLILPVICIGQEAAGVPPGHHGNK